MRFISVLVTSVCFAGAAHSDGVGSYGTPGLIDMPTAQALPDGALVLSHARGAGTARSAMSFQITPRLTGTFRYAKLNDYFNGRVDLYDRSFDLHFLLMEETLSRPAVAIGLRDFGGTGIYGGEYLVASKQVTPGLTLTGGVGWGRLASRGSFKSPLGALSDRFETRPEVSEPGLSGTGQLDAGAWFRGPMAVFGGVEWRATDRLSFQAEYASDAYDRERAAGLVDKMGPVNVGLRYALNERLSLGAYLLGGQELGVMVSTQFDPGARRRPSRDGAAPYVAMQRGPGNRAGLTVALAEQGFRLRGQSWTAQSAHIRVENIRWDTPALAFGRAVRVLANAAPPEVETLSVSFDEAGMPTTTLSLPRAVLEGPLTPERLWQATTISDGRDAPRVTEGPRFVGSLSPYINWQLFDPDSPVRIEAGLTAQGSLALAPGTRLNGVLRLPLLGNADEATRLSNSELPHVRSDAFLYARTTDLNMPRLTLDTLFRPGPDLFGRVSLGYLEPMYAGVSAELLWHPVDRRLALGAEVNVVRQRDFDMRFSLRDYQIATGHVSAYYDLGQDYTAQLDIGRYLAGDWGATVSLDRVFPTGARIGAFATLTDVSFEEFGEGSFDKGIRVEIPTSVLSGKASRQVIAQTIRPVQRDGGARLNVANRLYPTVRDSDRSALRRSWATALN